MKPECSVFIAATCADPDDGTTAPSLHWVAHLNCYCLQVSKFGSEVPIGRPGQPKEFCAPAVFLACEDSSYVVGAILGVTGGGLIN